MKNDEEMLEILEQQIGDSDSLMNGENIFIGGIKFRYEENSDLHSEDVEGQLMPVDSESGLSGFKREGVRETSYGSWTSTIWFGWSIYE